MILAIIVKLKAKRESKSRFQMCTSVRLRVGNAMGQAAFPDRFLDARLSRFRVHVVFRLGCRTDMSSVNDGCT